MNRLWYDVLQLEVDCTLEELAESLAHVSTDPQSHRYDGPAAPVGKTFTAEATEHERSASSRGKAQYVPLGWPLKPPTAHHHYDSVALGKIGPHRSTPSLTISPSGRTTLIRRARSTRCTRLTIAESSGHPERSDNCLRASRYESIVALRTLACLPQFDFDLISEISNLRHQLGLCLHLTNITRVNFHASCSSLMGLGSVRLNILLTFSETSLRACIGMRGIWIVRLP